MASNHGIDYGAGTTNVGKGGIRFGVIPMHALSPYAHEDFEGDYGPATCGQCGNPAVEYDDERHGEYPEIRGCSDFACETCERVISSDDAYGDEPIGSHHDADGIKAELHSDGDVFVLESPYYTHAQYCSPCAPGACYLLSPTDKGGPRCYCLPHDWFEGGKAPYPVWRILDGTLVKPERK
jgi:hypothetical protein